MSNKPVKQIKKRYADIKKRGDGTWWEEIKNAENAISLYEQTCNEDFKQKKWVIKYLKNIIRTQKIGFFFSKTIVRLFQSPDGDNIHPGEDVLSAQKDNFNFKEMSIPLPMDKNGEKTLDREFSGCVLPYLINDIAVIRPFETLLKGEGPYEIDENVCLRKSDIVIDCGANMGLFSAVASAKGCIIYAFEPFPYVIDNYLAKTATLNKNINICQYALWDSETVLNFKTSDGNITGSKIVGVKESGKTIEVKAIKLDDFVQRNNLPKVDFIKADIEGSERNMLRGAKKVLKDFAPKLSICTYHLPDDPKVLREIILDANPKYKIVEDFKKMYAYVP